MPEKLPPPQVGRPNLHLPVHAVRVSDDDGDRPAAITTGQVRAWLDRANDVYRPAGIEFTWDGTLHPLESTAVNSLEGDADAQWKKAKKELNDIAAASRKVVLAFRHGADPNPTAPTGGGFSWWTYDWVAMPGFDHTWVCGNQNIGLLAHELGHYLGLPHTFPGDPATNQAFVDLAALEQWYLAKGSTLSIFDADSPTVADTPADPFVRQLDCSGETVVPIAGTQVPNLRGNAMSYWFHTGVSTLTSGQVQRVRETVEARRKSFGLAVGYDWHPADEFAVYGYTYTDLRARYDDAWPTGWRLSTLRPHAGSADRWSAVWRPSTEPEIQYYARPYPDYRAKYDELWPQGWRLAQLRVHTVGTSPLYTAVWQRSTEPEIQLYGAGYEQYRKRYDELWPQGWRLHQIAPHTALGQVRYTAVWRRSTAPEIQLYGAGYEQYRKRYDELWPQGWRLHLLEQYESGGDIRYVAVWRPGMHRETQRYESDFASFKARYDELWAGGWRLALLSAVESGGQVRYTAVWR